MTAFTSTFDDIRGEFNAFIGDIVYATMVTIDRRNRPRTRILIPVWEVVDSLPVEWLATIPSPGKSGHLKRRPAHQLHLWAQRNNSVHIDTVAMWDDSPANRRHVWDLYAQPSPPGAGHALGRFWTGVEDPNLRTLRIDPWRIQVIRGTDLRSRKWTGRSRSTPALEHSAATRSSTATPPPASTPRQPKPTTPPSRHTSWTGSATADQFRNTA